MNSINAGVKFFCFFCICLAVVPPQLLIKSISKGPALYILPCLWHRAVCRCFGIKVIIKGTPQTTGHIVYVSNHLSYLDIPVIGSVLKASFVAKKEVQRWPVFGFLAGLQNTVFITRSRSAALQETGSVANILGEAKNLIIFPEGTSTDGREVVPFKSSIFSMMIGEGLENLVIQPFTISMRTVDGKEAHDQGVRDIYSWHRDMTTELPAHLWRFAKSKGAVIVLDFHVAVEASHFTDRKNLAKICHDSVSKGLESAHKVRKLHAS